jgi:hypothetical protein
VPLAALATREQDFETAVSDTQNYFKGLSSGAEQGLNGIGGLLRAYGPIFGRPQLDELRRLQQKFDTSLHK